MALIRHIYGFFRVLAAPVGKTVTRAFAVMSMQAALLVAVSADAQGAVYRLMINDRIQLQVVEWRAETGTPQTWDALSGAYAVDASGQISVPLLGSIEAVGLTTPELSAEIASQIQSVVGLVGPPGVAVEVIAYNPVIVAGSVAVPGAHPYSPGMTVAKAVALAGGERRLGDGDLRASAQAAGAAARAREVLARQLAREARLIAERDGLDAVIYPDDLGHPGGKIAEQQIKETENAVFESRRDGLRREIEGLEDLRDLYTAEENSLQQKKLSLDNIIALTEARLGDLENLSESGLVRGQQLLDAQRAVGDLRTQSLNIDLALFRARAQLSMVKRERVAVEANRVADIAEQLAQTRAEITAQKRELATSQSILETFDADAVSMAGPGVGTELGFDLVRQGEDRAESATLGTVLAPGDVLTATRIVSPESDRANAGGPIDPVSDPDTGATIPSPPAGEHNL